MKLIYFLLIIILIISSIFVPLFYWEFTNPKERPEDLFFGVSFGGKTFGEAKLLIDKVKNYTNFFLVNSWDITINETALNQVCNYAAQANLSFIVFFDFISLVEHEDAYLFHPEWVTNAKEKWGDNFLGIYIYEEPGGKQIETGLFDEFYHGGNRSKMFENVTTYTEAKEVYVSQIPQSWSFHYLQNENISKFTSDYALYWFDYLAGYDTIFTELGFNHSRAKHIGLCRGAAKLQGKEWGSIITWTYNEPPYLVSGPEIFKDMILAYEANAKYIVLFNFPKYPKSNPFGILLDEHFMAMEDFWKYIQEHPGDYGKNQGDIAFVLPKDYGWGMRNPEDKIWGLWDADSLSLGIWEKMNKLLDQYNTQLDIVYNDPGISLEEYSKVVYWNDENLD